MVFRFKHGTIVFRYELKHVTNTILLVYNIMVCSSQYVAYSVFDHETNTFSLLQHSISSNVEAVIELRAKNYVKYCTLGEYTNIFILMER